MQQTMQQQRAAYALNKVKTASTNPTINQKEYKSYASQLPAMIHTNGLGQAVAFFRSKGAFHKNERDRSNKERAYCLLYMTLSDWLCSNGTTLKPMPQQPFSRFDDVLDAITQSNMRDYRLAQAEAQMLMDWIKKFAKAYMTDEASTQGESTP